MVNNHMKLDDVIDFWSKLWKDAGIKFYEYLQTILSSNLWRRCFRFGMELIIGKHGGLLFIRFVMKAQFITIQWILFVCFHFFHSILQYCWEFMTSTCKFYFSLISWFIKILLYSQHSFLYSVVY